MLVTLLLMLRRCLQLGVCNVYSNGIMATEYRYSGKGLLSNLWYFGETVLEEIRKNMKI
jgi:hypothetical protein